MNGTGGYDQRNSQRFVGGRIHLGVREVGRI